MDNELYHYGMKGMRWGIRRYQNKDGSLTPAGKKRYNKEMAKLKAEEKVLKNKQKTQAKMDKLDEKRKDVEALRKGKTPPSTLKKAKETPKRSLKDLSDDELRTIVNRMQLEQQYRTLAPEKVSTGRKFANAVMKNVVAPAATEVGKQVVKDAMQKAVKKASENTNKK